MATEKLVGFPSAPGADSPVKITDVKATAATSIKLSPGFAPSFLLDNTANAAPTFFKFYDTVASPDVAVDVPDVEIGIAAGLSLLVTLRDVLATDTKQVGFPFANTLHVAAGIAKGVGSADTASQTNVEVTIAAV